MKAVQYDGKRNAEIKMRAKFFICFIVIWTVQMAVSIYYCTQKMGFHEDEYYTYYSTARTNGLHVTDGQWMDREVYENEFVVLPEQRFQYGFVKLVQSWDVHPPMYYWFFHTVASLVPNVFSKWIGLSMNLFFHGVNIILLAYLSYLIGVRDRKMALLVTVFFGMGPAVMSGVVFIRMYEMLTTFVLLCAILQIRVVQGDRASGAALPMRTFLIPMMMVTYIGFLTHYYYFIFLFFMSLAFCIWLLWRDRHIRNCIRYAVSQGIAFTLAFLTYPSCLGHMFRGQRGAQATKNFFDLSNTIARIQFFWNLLDRYVFGRLFFVLLLVILLLVVIAKKGAKKGVEPLHETECGSAYFILFFAVAGYFLTVSKTALMFGEMSIRYQIPVYGMIVLLAFAAFKELWHQMMWAYGRSEEKKTGGRRKYVEGCVVLVCLLVGLLNVWREEVLFLYPEDREQTAFAQECAKMDTPVIYFYRTGEEWCVWAVTNELFAYPQVYFVAVDGEGAIFDERIQNANSLVVYIANGADEKKNLQRILDSVLALADCQCERVFEEKYCSVYYLNKEQ